MRPSHYLPYLNLFNRWVEKRFLAIVVSLFLLSLILRVLLIIFFPHFRTEDSDAYIRASEQYIHHSAYSAYYMRYRQIGYPFVIYLFRQFFTLPLYALVIFQNCLTLVMAYLLFNLSKKLNFSKIASILLLTVLLFHHRHLIYANAIAPETLVCFFVVLTIYLFSIHVRSFDENLRVCLGLMVLIPFVVMSAVAVKEQFIVFLGVLFLSYLFCLLIRIRKKLTKKLLCVAILFEVIFSVFLYQGYRALTRRLLVSERKNPICTDFASAINCHYMDFNSTKHSDFKKTVKSLVETNKKKLEHWDYAYKNGIRKVNHCYEDDREYLFHLNQYMAKTTPEIPPEDRSCRQMEIGTELFYESVTSDFFHYVRYWVFPELIRAIFSEHRNEFGGYFRHTSTRPADPMIVELAKEMKESKLYFYLWNETPFSKWFTSILNRIIRPRRILTLFFFIYVLIWPYVAWRKKEWEWEEILLTFILIAYVVSSIATVVSIQWYYERYFIYISFGYIMLGIRLIDRVFKFLPHLLRSL